MTKFVLIEKTSDCKVVEVKNLKIEDLFKKWAIENQLKISSI